MIRIILVEDLDLLREDLSYIIKNQPDMEVVDTAKTGEEAIAIGKNTEFDIMLLDIEMETINAGIKAAERILENKPNAKIIFLTAHETEDVIINAMSSGAVDYIIKGCPDEQVFEHIRKAYDGEPMLNHTIQETIMQEYTRLRRSEQSLLFFIHNVSQLTQAERELVKLLLEGKKVKEIAEIRYVEIVTVKTQIKSLLRKFGCRRTKEIVEMIKELNIQHLF